MNICGVKHDETDHFNDHQIKTQIGTEQQSSTINNLLCRKLYFNIN